MNDGACHYWNRLEERLRRLLMRKRAFIWAQAPKTSCHFLAWLKDIHDDISPETSQKQKRLVWSILSHAWARDRLAEGGTVALAASWLTDRQGRLDYITTSVLPLWHLTAARASRMEQSSKEERFHSYLGRELTIDHVGKTDCLVVRRACASSTCLPPKAYELIRLVFSPTLSDLTALGRVQGPIPRP